MLASSLGTLVLADPTPWVTESLLSLCLATASSVNPESWWTAWSFSPWVVTPLGIFAFLFAGGVRTSMKEDDLIGRMAWFSAGILVLVVALTSPLCRSQLEWPRHSTSPGRQRGLRP
jgi:hypothetical protein